jgi:hypothetical protein
MPELSRKLIDKLLHEGIFYTPWNAKILVERGKKLYNRVRPHSSGISANGAGAKTTSMKAW